MTASHLQIMRSWTAVVQCATDMSTEQQSYLLCVHRKFYVLVCVVMCVWIATNFAANKINAREC